MTNKKTLRQIMTEEIGKWGWLDYSYKSETKNETPSEEEYVEHLNELEDSEFLFRYKQVSIASDSLD